MITVLPRTEEHLKFLNYVRGHYDLDFWTEPRGLNVPVDIRIPAELGHMIHEMRSMNIPGKLKIRDVQR